MKLVNATDAASGAEVCIQRGGKPSSQSDACGGSVAGDPDLVDVLRKAHELSGPHGWNACIYAAKLARGALAEGKAAEHAFWLKVEAALAPRKTLG